MKDEKFYNDLRGKLADYEMPVSDDVWSYIEGRLNASSSSPEKMTSVSRRKPRVIVLWSALAAAACIATAVFIIRPDVTGNDTVAIINDTDNNRTEAVSDKAMQGDNHIDGDKSEESTATTEDMTLDNGALAERENISHANGKRLAIVSKDGVVQEYIHGNSKGREEASEYNNFHESDTSGNIVSSFENHDDITLGSIEASSEQLYAKTDMPVGDKEETTGVVQGNEKIVSQQENKHSDIVRENEKPQRSLVVRDREPQWYAYDKMQNKRHAAQNEHKGMLASFETGVHVGGASGRMTGMGMSGSNDKWIASNGVVGWGDILPEIGFGTNSADNGKVPQGWGGSCSGIIYDSSWGNPAALGMTNANTSQSSNSPVMKKANTEKPSGDYENNPYSQVSGVEVIRMQKSPMLTMPQKSEVNADVISDEEHDFPIRLGWSLRYYLTDRLSLESGVNYTYLKSTLMHGNGGRDKQMLHYFGVPLSVGYSFLKYNNLSLYASLGAEVDYMAFGKIGDEKVTTHPFQLSASARLGAQYSITETLGMFLEPGVIYYFDDRSSLHTIFKKQPWEFGVSAGLRINLR